MISTRRDEITIKDRITELAELSSLEGLCKKITSHVLCGTVFNSDVTCFDVICNKKISDIQMAGAFATGCPTIFFKEDGTFVVLKDNRFIDNIALGV
jgi:hypothetical protein